MVPKKELTFVLSYLGYISLDLRTKLRYTTERDLPYCKLKVIFRSCVDLTHCFTLKIHLRKKLALE